MLVIVLKFRPFLFRKLLIASFQFVYNMRITHFSLSTLEMFSPKKKLQVVTHMRSLEIRIAVFDYANPHDIDTESRS